MIRKLLIANRGEIAVRVIRAAQELGVQTVAIYSHADAHSIHVALADEAVAIGPSEPAASYLDIQKVLSAAKATGAEAIHPGYGFLSERDEFAQACQDAGVIFVGPSADAMRRLGSKIDAKKLAVASGVPITPGFFETGATNKQLAYAADQIGYPVMLKASAGGGGRGMRVVRENSSFIEQLQIASDEALKAFGDGAMMVEKLVVDPRHIEVQFIADSFGNVACLFERECSIQRRHQKLIEEAPSVVGAGLWEGMKRGVESLIRASGYTGAGTAEFMFDKDSGEYYFLEVNARLQVEHPVTELISCTDLVQWQLRIASGEKLELDEPLMAGDRAAINGHAIEARIVAEDPAHGFMPSIGTISAWAEPKRPGVRVDTGFAAGSEVSRYYDSLLAKVIAHGENREQAIDRLIAALEDFHVLGVRTNIAYVLDILRHPGFRSGDIDTGFLGREFSDWSGNDVIPPELSNVLAATKAASPQLNNGSGPASRSFAWAISDSFRNA
jgi:3-methylcrotonyl-CoA carboxylase alpha subunit